MKSADRGRSLSRFRRPIHGFTGETLSTSVGGSLDDSQELSGDDKPLVEIS